MKKGLLVVLMAVMAISVFGMSGTAQVTCYRILFAMGNDGEEKIYAINPDGTAFVTLSGLGVVGDSMPVSSPDGSRIVFISTRYGKRDIFLMNADGSNVVQLTDTEDEERFPSFSKDGKRIVFDREIQGSRKIFIHDLETRKERCLTPNDGMDMDPAFSPDGTRIAFYSKTGAGFQVFVMNTDGTGRVQLTAHSNTFCLSPCWSPDGKEIAFVACLSGGTNSIMVMNVDGRETRTLVSANEFYVGDPSWSPDGQSIVYIASKGGHWNLYSISPTGSNPRRLTYRFGHMSAPSWSVVPAGLQSGVTKLEPDFREVRWGMSREQVRSVEQATFEEEFQGRLYYTEYLNGLKCELVYVFEGNVLTRAAYIVEEDFVDKNRYLEEFAELKALLTQKYGPPCEDIVDWKDGSFKDSPSMWGFAVGMGHLELLASWETENTEICLLLCTFDWMKPEVSFMLSYQSKEYEAMNGDEEEETLSDL